MSEDNKGIDLGLGSTTTVVTPNYSHGGTSPSPAVATAEQHEDIDENDITIADKDAPIVMLFGPPSSGKSMTIVRLARYLRDRGYVIKADPTFKSSDKYKARCEQFHRDLNSREPLPGTAKNEFLMVQIHHHGKVICQILEAPGEDYFNGETSVSNLRPYMQEITTNPKNRKVWVFITEAIWSAKAKRKEAYVQRIKNFRNQYQKPSDRVVLLYNKVDKKEELMVGGKVHQAAALKAMEDEYEGISEIFKNPNPITSLWRPYNYTFVPFKTGTYHEPEGRFTPSEDKYPAHLWSVLTKCFRG